MPLSLHPKAASLAATVASVLAGVLVCLLVCLLVCARASPALASAEEPDTRETTTTYWLSAELQGPARARSAAVAAMTPSDALADPSPPALAGHYVAIARDLAATLAWIDRWAFDGAPLPPPEERRLSPLPAPIPGGALLDHFGVHLLALVVDRRVPGGASLPFPWPQADAEPPRRWRPAALLSQQAPLFAAPEARLPPFTESHELIDRREDLYLLGIVDRCADGAPRRCMRWAQVLVHSHGRWRGGYLPAIQVATTDGWIRAKSGLPRIHAIPAGFAEDAALLLLVVRTADYELHRALLRLPADGDAFPAYTLELASDAAILTIAGEEVARRPLNRTIDARPR